MYRLITNDHFKLGLEYAVAVVPLNLHEVESGIADVELVGPLDDELGLQIGSGLVGLNLE